jgi:hypothetical protein
MAIITSQKISSYYERYKKIEVTYTKEIIHATGLLTQEVVLKCVGDFWPCVIHSSSFTWAKVVASLNSGLQQKLQQANNLVSLRFCFTNPDNGAPAAFFVSCKAAGFAPYSGSREMGLFHLEFIQRPPDDLIETMGRMLDANINCSRRRDERVAITAEAIRKLRLFSKDGVVFVDGVPRRCIIRDLSFSGAKIIMMGVSKFLVQREGKLRLDFDDPRESLLIRGKFVRSEDVQGRKELIALGMQFDNDLVPMRYKIRINDYLGLARNSGS